MWLVISLYIVFLLVFLLIPPLYDGIERKIRAKLHSRVGPPTVLQTWYDILKLFKKELVVTDTGLLSILLGGLLLITVIITALSMPLGFNTPLTSSTASLVLFTVLLIGCQLLWVSLSLTPGNPYATVGVFREAVLGMINEFFLVLGLVALMFYIGSPSFASMTSIRPSITYALIFLLLAVSAYIGSGRIPYDIAEAEPELASGILIEFSGPLLGITLYSHFLKRAILYGLLADMIVLPLARIIGVVGAAILYPAILLIIWVIFAVISVLLGRTRVDIAPKSMLKIYIPLSIAILIAWIAGV
ncbi:MAG: hydrogenase [Crenarchaeota archaeon]|nr:hydrogenase [Thermoproteota archaeon]